MCQDYYSRSRCLARDCTEKISEHLPRVLGCMLVNRSVTWADRVCRPTAGRLQSIMLGPGLTKEDMETITDESRKVGLADRIYKSSVYGRPRFI